MSLIATGTDTVRPPALSTHRQLIEVPGPRGIPVLGNAHQITAHRAHLDIEQWGREFGPVFRFKMGKKTVLALCDHELIASVMKDRPDRFRRSSHSTRIAAELGMKPGLFHAEGQMWRDQRRMVMSSFSPSHVRAYFPSLLKVTQRLHGRWLKAARSGAAIALQEDLMRYTVDGVAGLAFGTDINTLESNEEVIQQHLDKIFPSLFRRILSRFPYWRYVRLPVDRELDRSVVALNKAIDDFITRAREQMRADPELRKQPANLLQAMIVAADEPDSNIDDNQVAGNVLTMLLAGEDTTANTLAWMVHLLLRNPQALQRAKEEVMRVAPDPAAFTPEQMASLDYIEACASETMRLKPVAPFLVMEALIDTVIGDVQTPKGTLIWCVMRPDAVNAAHFPDPQAFKPERWLANDQAHTDASLASPSAKRASTPFGAGPRMCPGRYLALLEIKMAMAMLLSRFDVLSVGTADGSEPAEKMAFSMAPHGLSMKLREHTATSRAPT